MTLRLSKKLEIEIEGEIRKLNGAELLSYVADLRFLYLLLTDTVLWI